MFALLLLLLSALLAAIAFYNFYHKRKHLPPGPTPLPLLGNILSIFRNPPGEKCFLEWRRRYGEVYTYWMGELPVVVIAGHEKILETFQKDGDAYAGRKTFEEFQKTIRGGHFGVFLTEGDLWRLSSRAHFVEHKHISREHRRFALHLFRDLGVGKNLMQEKILDEFTAMAAKIDAALAETPGDELDLAHRFIDPAVGSIINNMLLGYRFDDDRLNEFYELKNCLSDLFTSNRRLGMILVFSRTEWCKKLPYFKGLLNDVLMKQRRLYDFFGRKIDEHRARIDFDDLDSPASDYVEAYLKEQARCERLGQEHTFTNMQLKAMCFDLWVAGQETSSTTLAWAFAFLLNYPKVIRKVHTELDEVIGAAERRLVTIADRPNLPYINAVVNEVQRCANLVPQNVLHKLTRDVVVDGYLLKKGTVVVPQISAVFIDEQTFENPWEFRPERFVDSEGKLQRCDALLPFSVGKRQCLGEPLARYELFLFLANILQRYEMLPGKMMPSLRREKPAVSPTPIQCPMFMCHLQKRN